VAVSAPANALAQGAAAASAPGRHGAAAEPQPAPFATARGHDLAAAAHPATPGVGAAAVVMLVPPHRNARASNLAALGPGTAPSDGAGSMRPDGAYVNMAWDDLWAVPKAWAQRHHKHVGDTTDKLRHLLTWLRDALANSRAARAPCPVQRACSPQASRSHIRRSRSASAVSATCLWYLRAKALGPPGRDFPLSTYALSGRCRWRRRSVAFLGRQRPAGNAGVAARRHQRHDRGSIQAGHGWVCGHGARDCGPAVHAGRSRARRVAESRARRGLQARTRRVAQGRARRGLQRGNRLIGRLRPCTRLASRL